MSILMDRACGLALQVLSSDFSLIQHIVENVVTGRTHYQVDFVHWVNIDTYYGQIVRIDGLHRFKTITPLIDSKQNFREVVFIYKSVGERSRRRPPPFYNQYSQ